MPKFEVKTWISRESKQKNKKFQGVRGQFSNRYPQHGGYNFKSKKSKGSRPILKLDGTQSDTTDLTSSDSRRLKEQRPSS